MTTVDDCQHIRFRGGGTTFDLTETCVDCGATRFWLSSAGEWSDWIDAR
jgi:hypothetical protein